MRGDAFAISEAKTAFSAQLYYLIHVFDRIIKFGSITCFPVDEPSSAGAVIGDGRRAHTEKSAENAKYAADFAARDPQARNWP